MRTLVVAVAALLSAATLQAAGGVTPPPAFGEVILTESGVGEIARFSQCANIGTSNDVIASMGVGPTIQTDGKFHTGDVICSRRLTDDLTLWNWRQDAIEHHSGFKKNGKVQLIDTGGNVTLSWTFANGWLSKISIDLGGTAITETIALTTDQLSRDGLALVPDITWNPQTLTYGARLGADQLNATTPAPGTFTYDPGEGTLLNAGPHTLHATFHPADPTQFVGVTVSAQVTVLRASLTATADDQTKIYGSPNPPLTFKLNGFVNGETSSVVSGAPALSTTATTTSDAGSYPITIEAGTLAAANYSFQFVNGTLTIKKAEQSIHWDPPGPIVYGTLLGPAQLNATVSVVGPAPAGALTYSPAAGTLLDAGDQLLIVTAAETSDYNQATASVHLTVMRATPVFTDLSSPLIARGTAATTLSGRISAGALLVTAGETVSITLNGGSNAAPIQGDGRFSSVFATGALAASPTPYPITYSYAGDRNFNAISGSGSLTVAVIDTFIGTVTTPAVDNDNANRPFHAKFSGAVAGNVPGDFTAFVNYTPSAPGPNVRSRVTDGTWKLHADGKKPLPKGMLWGTITGGTIQWNAAGKMATVELQMRIDRGNGDFANVTGTAVFRDGVWNATATPKPTIAGQLLLFY